LALRNARDWRRGEDIRLQELQDHHIFPQAYLRRHGFTKRVDVNSIANRTLISDETNAKIKDDAPADYLGNPEIFPSGAGAALLEPHFMDATTLPLMEAAVEALTNHELARLYNRFLETREAAMIKEIRRACGISEMRPALVGESEPDEVAADVQDASPTEDEAELLELVEQS
jgi:hypothetical protein